MKKILSLIQGLSIATVLLVAGLPAYGASIYISSPEVQSDDDPIEDIVGRVGDTISWTGYIDTTGLEAPLQVFDMYAERDPKEIAALRFEGADSETLRQYWPNFSVTESLNPDTGLIEIIGLRNGLPGLPPNYVGVIVEKIIIDLGPELINDGVFDFRIGVSSAIDVNGKDVTDQFTFVDFTDQSKFVSQEFEVQPVPEPSSILGLVLTGGLGAFLRKQKRKGQH